MTPRSGTGRRAAVLTALVFLVALNLRPALTSVGPLLPRIGAEEGLSEGAQGLLGALPLLAFALGSLLVSRLSARIGPERSVLAALMLLTAGILIRSYTGHTGLWVGTVVAGCAIAVGNVLVPAIVKRDYAGHISRATGVYSAFMGLAASTASAVAVPLAGTAGWRAALAFWAVPALVVGLVWFVRARPAPPAADHAAAVDGPPVWRQPTAWLLTAFMGVQSTSFYIMVNWLPTIETQSGVSAERAGLHLFVYQVVGIAAGLLIPRLMRRPDSQVAAAVASSLPMLAAALGLLLLPGLGVLWAVVAGAGSGSSLVVALSLISLRGRTHQETTRLSGMAQSLGYLFAAAGPFLAGYLAERTGGWDASLLLVAGLGLLQLLVSVPAGRPRAPAPPPLVRSGTPA